MFCVSGCKPLVGTVGCWVRLWLGVEEGDSFELKYPSLMLARVVWAEAGTGFDRVDDSLRSIWGATKRGGVSPPLNVLT